MSLTTTTNFENDSNVAGPSSQPATLCAICHTEAAKYTCPHCQVKTCSLPCSRSHKESTGCSGVRDKVAYVPMNQYGYATMVNDYTLLEEVSRKVDEWGREIAKGGLLANQSGNSIAGRGSRGGRGTIRSSGRTQDQRRYLAMQLGFRDVYMDVLPQGMDRAKRNRSFWDSKKRTALLTVEFTITPPREHATQEKRRISLRSNKNDWTKPIRDLVRSSLRAIKRDEKLLDWLGLDDEAESGSTPSSVLYVMKRPKVEDDPSDPNFGGVSYYKLDYNTSLSSALRNKHFVEYPTIELVDETEFKGLVVEEDGFRINPGERRPKRRKLDAETAKKTIIGLVGGYGSDEEEKNDERPNQLSALGGYAESSEEEVGESLILSDDEGDIDINGEGVVIEGTASAPEDRCDNDGDVEVGMDDALGATNMALEVEEIPSEDEEDVEWIDEEIAADEAKLVDLSAALKARQK